MGFVSVAYAQVDWHDFVVVEAVDFQPNEMGELLVVSFIIILKAFPGLI